MPFLVQQDCLCCKDMLHHCKRCWDRFHNGKKDKDYVPPAYFGESMFSAETVKGMGRFGIKHNSSIKPNKCREYEEGQYH